MPRQSRSRTPHGDSKNIIKMLKKLERRMDNLERHKRRRLSSSDSDSSLERQYKLRRTRNRSLDILSNEGN